MSSFRKHRVPSPERGPAAQDATSGSGASGDHDREHGIADGFSGRVGGPSDTTAPPPLPSRGLTFQRTRGFAHASNNSEGTRPSLPLRKFKPPSFKRTHSAAKQMFETLSGDIDARSSSSNDGSDENGNVSLEVLDRGTPRGAAHEDALVDIDYNASHKDTRPPMLAGRSISSVDFRAVGTSEISLDETIAALVKRSRSRSTSSGQPDGEKNEDWIADELLESLHDELGPHEVGLEDILDDVQLRQLEDEFNRLDAEGAGTVPAESVIGNDDAIASSVVEVCGPDADRLDCGQFVAVMAHALVNMEVSSSDGDSLCSNEDAMEPSGIHREGKECGRGSSATGEHRGGSDPENNLDNSQGETSWDLSLSLHISTNEQAGRGGAGAGAAAAEAAPLVPKADTTATTAHQLSADVEERSVELFRRISTSYDENNNNDNDRSMAIPLDLLVRKEIDPSVLTSRTARGADGNCRTAMLVDDDACGGDQGNNSADALDQPNMSEEQAATIASELIEVRQAMVMRAMSMGKSSIDAQDFFDVVQGQFPDLFNALFAANISGSKGSTGEGDDQEATSTAGRSGCKSKSEAGEQPGNSPVTLRLVLERDELVLRLRRSPLLATLPDKILYELSDGLCAAGQNFEGEGVDAACFREAVVRHCPNTVTMLRRLPSNEARYEHDSLAKTPAAANVKAKSNMASVEAALVEAGFVRSQESANRLLESLGSLPDDFAKVNRELLLAEDGPANNMPGAPRLLAVAGSSLTREEFKALVMQRCPEVLCITEATEAAYRRESSPQGTVPTSIAVRSRGKPPRPPARDQPAKPQSSPQPRRRVSANELAGIRATFKTLLGRGGGQGVTVGALAQHFAASIDEVVAALAKVSHNNSSASSQLHGEGSGGSEGGSSSKPAPPLAVAAQLKSSSGAKSGGSFFRRRMRSLGTSFDGSGKSMRADQAATTVGFETFVALSKAWEERELHELLAAKSGL